MLLFATNQTNLKQKQSFSVYLRFVSIEAACRAGLECFHAYWQCMYGKKHFQFSLFHACCTFFYPKFLGGWKRTKVLLKGGWCVELGRGGGFWNSCWRRVWAANTDKNEFSRAGRWEKKEDLTNSTSTLLWFYCKNWSGKCETSGDPVLPVMVWTGKWLWRHLGGFFLMFHKKRLRAKQSWEKRIVKGSWEGFLLKKSLISSEEGRFLL